MNREPYVMDCWFDSGCASFAQWHYPFENQEIFESSFPVDYICEAVDQTRGGSIRYWQLGQQSSINRLTGVAFLSDTYSISMERR